MPAGSVRRASAVCAGCVKGDFRGKQSKGRRVLLVVVCVVVVVGRWRRESRQGVSRSVVKANK